MNGVNLQTICLYLMHEKILRQLCNTNSEVLVKYGSDALPTLLSFLNKNAFYLNFTKVQWMHETLRIFVKYVSEKSAEKIYLGDSTEDKVLSGKWMVHCMCILCWKSSIYTVNTHVRTWRNGTCCRTLLFHCILLHQLIE